MRREEQVKREDVAGSGASEEEKREEGGKKMAKGTLKQARKAGERRKNPAMRTQS